jgi:hypothetical protein
VTTTHRGRPMVISQRRNASRRAAEYSLAGSVNRMTAPTLIMVAEEDQFSQASAIVRR